MILIAREAGLASAKQNVVNEVIINDEMTYENGSLLKFTEIYISRDSCDSKIPGKIS